MRNELEGLVAAPINDPTVGPALLTGRAAAVFFHEVFGHRAEGHRQKDVSEGQTFSKKVGEQILPEFLSITDDTTMKKLGDRKSTRLNSSHRCISYAVFCLKKKK